ncbi:MAG: helix-turn-helix domain-containing protein [Thaumarchaeota archaeon]|nr:helix-turn-helix domain-containing protein [Candidatus Calditenuaceae archaeon]MDW8043035.1 helix-turn-helix domain-containing protein [Nitrososphaerota archaeon]
MDALDEALVNQVASYVASDIVLSPEPGKTMRKWRLLFQLSQREVASQMGVSPPVLSDYEKGKRMSPGVQFVSRFVRSLIELDVKRGGHNVMRFVQGAIKVQRSIMDIVEFHVPIELRDVVRAVNGEFVTLKEEQGVLVHGYTLVDSIRAILELGPYDFVNIFGRNSMRVIAFANVTTGRSPMVAIRVFPLKPKAVVLHGPVNADSVDPLAVKLSQLERIPLIVSRLPTVEDLLEGLRSLIGR